MALLAARDAANGDDEPADVLSGDCHDLVDNHAATPVKDMVIIQRIAGDRYGTRVTEPVAGGTGVPVR